MILNDIENYWNILNVFGIIWIILDLFGFVPTISHYKMVFYMYSDKSLHQVLNIAEMCWYFLIILHFIVVQSWNILPLLKCVVDTFVMC